MKINKEVLVEISTSPLVAEKSNEPKKKKKKHSLMITASVGRG